MINFLINLVFLAGSVAALALYVIIVVLGGIEVITERLFPYQDKGILFSFIWLILTLTAPVAAIVTLSGKVFGQ
jgi:hypothetical protein